MKKLGFLLIMLSLGAFTVGCTPDKKDDKKTPAADGGAADGGSADGGAADGGAADAGAADGADAGE